MSISGNYNELSVQLENEYRALITQQSQENNAARRCNQKATLIYVFVGATILALTIFATIYVSVAGFNPAVTVMGSLAIPIVGLAATFCQEPIVRFYFNTSERSLRDQKHQAQLQDLGRKKLSSLPLTWKVATTRGVVTFTLEQLRMAYKAKEINQSTLVYCEEATTLSRNSYKQWYQIGRCPALKTLLENPS